MQALLKSRDGTLSPNVLKALGKPMVFTGEAKDGTEWSFVFEAHSATGSTEVSHGPTLVKKWRASATSCADERDRRGLGRTFVLHRDQCESSVGDCPETTRGRQTAMLRNEAGETLPHYGMNQLQWHIRQKQLTHRQRCRQEQQKAKAKVATARRMYGSEAMDKESDESVKIGGRQPHGSAERLDS